MSEFMNKQGTGDLGVLGGYGRCSSQCAASSLEIPLTPTQYFSLLCDSSVIQIMCCETIAVTVVVFTLLSVLLESWCKGN